MDVARGLDYLHSYGVIHRGLMSVSHVFNPAARNVILTKLVKQNVVVNTAGRACLSADIGSTPFIHSEELQTDSTDGTTRGPRWTALEVLEIGKFSKQSDVFSFGFVAAEVCSR